MHHKPFMDRRMTDGIAAGNAHGTTDGPAPPGFHGPLAGVAKARVIPVA